MCWVVPTACRVQTEPFDTADAREVTAVALTDFLRRNPPNTWPVVYVSDEHAGFAMDSLFIGLIPPSPVPLQVARRVDVWVSYDIVRDGGLLLEPSRPAVLGDGSVVQTMRFSSTPDFGGELWYRLSRVVGRWSIREMRILWIT